MKFYNYSNVILQGSSASGKTQMMREILRQKGDLFFESVTRVIFVYEHWQELYDEMLKDDPDIIFTKDIPNTETLYEYTKGHRHSLLCLDDKQMEVGESANVATIFTRLSHHFKISCFCLMQGATLKGRHASDVLRNAHYNIVFKSGKEAHLLRALGAQMNDYRALSEAYKLAIDDRQYRYLCVNNHPKASHLEKYSTDILPSDGVCTLFHKKK